MSICGFLRRALSLGVKGLTSVGVKVVTGPVKDASGTVKDVTGIRKDIVETKVARFKVEEHESVIQKVALRDAREYDPKLRRVILEARREEMTRSRRLIFIVMPLVVALLFWGVRFVIGTRTSQNTVIVAQPSFSRDVLAPGIRIDKERIFSDANVRSLNEGDGIEVKFSITFHDSTLWGKTFDIEKIKVTGRTNWAERRAYVEKRMAEFDQVEGEFTHYRAQLVYEVLLDNTEGVNTMLRGQVEQKVRDLNIREQLKRGNGAEFWTFKISSAWYRDYAEAVVGEGEGENAYGRIQQKLNDLLQEDQPKDTTHLADGLCNALGKNEGKKARTVLIFSDGLENSDLANFYTNPPLPDKYTELAAKLQSREQCPDLTGVWVFWYAPKIRANSDNILRSLKFWKAFLESKGAKAEVEY
jgi:hypothetical protein